MICFFDDNWWYWIKIFGFGFLFLKILGISEILLFFVVWFCKVVIFEVLLNICDGIFVELVFGFNFNVFCEVVCKEFFGCEFVIILVIDSFCCGVLVKM